MTGSWFAGPALASDGGALTVGHIEVLRGDIFSDQEVQDAGGLVSIMRRTMNGLHTRTRAHVLERELLFREGDPFRPALLQETARNLRELGFLNNVSVTATDTTPGGKVNIRVQVRDSWSLQTNLSYSRSAGGDVRWNVTLSENNFLGEGMTLGAGLGADENSSFSSFWLRRRRLTAAHLVLGVDYSQREDGHVRNLFVSRPFYSLADRWSFFARGFDNLFDTRYYLSHAGPAGADPAAEASLYALIPRHEQSILTGLLRRFSPPDSGRLWRLGGGLEIRDNNFDVGRQSSWELSDDRWADLGYLSQEGSALAREQGLLVWPHLWVQTEGRTWTESRYLLHYGQVEDVLLAWRLELKIGPGGATMGTTRGSDGSLWRAEAHASRWWRLGPGMVRTMVFAEGQAGDAGNRYHRVNAQTGWLAHYGSEDSPWLTRLVAEIGHGDELSGDRAMVLGLNRGIRTLDFDGMAGDRLARWNLEQGKAAPWEVLGLLKGGAAVFYSGGAAWWHDEDRDLSDARHEVGFGLRVGPTRSSSAVTSKLDISWSLDGSRGPVFTAVSRGFF